MVLWIPLSFAGQKAPCRMDFEPLHELLAAMPIPELPEEFLGITNREHLRCKNFRFAVSAFGYPPHRG